MSIVAAGLIFLCTPTLVADGDGPVWCAEGPRIRIAGIAARELDGTCRRGHPCPRAGPIAARNALVELLGGSRGEVRIANAGISHIRLRAAPMCFLSTGPAGGRSTGAFRPLAHGRNLSLPRVAPGNRPSP